MLPNMISMALLYLLSALLGLSTASPVAPRDATITPSPTEYVYTLVEYITLPITTPLPSCPTGVVTDKAVCQDAGCVANIIALHGIVATDQFSCYTAYPVTASAVVTTSTCDASSTVKVYSKAWGGPQTRCVSAEPTA